MENKLKAQCDQCAHGEVCKHSKEFREAVAEMQRATVYRCGENGSSVVPIRSIEYVADIKVICKFFSSSDDAIIRGGGN